VELAFGFHVRALDLEQPHPQPCGQGLEALDEALRALRAVPGPWPLYWQSPDRSETADPYRTLAVDPSAELELVSIAYRHGSRLALGRRDERSAEALARAYEHIRAHARDKPAMPSEPAPARDDAPKRWSYRRRAPAGPEILGKRSDGRSVAGFSRWLARSRRRTMRTLRSLGTGRAQRRVASTHDLAWIDRGAGDALSVVARPVGVLHVFDGDRRILSLDLRDCAEYTVGSGPGCDIRLFPPPGGSRMCIAGEHLRLTVGLGFVSVRQVAAGEAALVNGRPAIIALLCPGDELALGSYRMQYTVEQFRVDGWRVQPWSS
jgi:hypothetical protein